MDDARRGAAGRRDRRRSLQPTTARAVRLRPQATARPRAAVRRQAAAGGPGIRAHGRRATAPDRVTLHWDIADGYYLYRDKVKVAVADGDARSSASPSIPGGEAQARRLLRRPGGVRRRRWWRRCRWPRRRARARSRSTSATRAAPRPGSATRRSTSSCRSSWRRRRCGCAAAGRRAGSGPDAVRAGPARRQDPQRQPARRARDVLRRGTAARVHALRAADGADPLGDHRGRRPRPARLARPRVLAVAGLRARHGAHLYGRGRRVRRRGPAGAGVLPAAVDHRRCSPRCSCCSRSACSACSTCRCRPRSSRASPT